MAAVWRHTPSEVIEQALAQFHPGSPPRVGHETDASQLQASIEAVLARTLRDQVREVLKEMHEEVPVTDTDSNEAGTRPADTPPTRPALGQTKLTPLKAAEMKGKRAAGTPIKTLLEEYGISKATVFRYLKET